MGCPGDLTGARDRFRRACATVVGLLPGRLRALVAPSLIGFAVVNGFTLAVDLLLLALLIDGLGLPLGWASPSRTGRRSR